MNTTVRQTPRSAIVRFAPQPRARVRLFCFHSAGGGPSMYREWGRALPEHVEVCAVCLPGREQLFTLPVRNDLLEIVERVAPAVEPLLDLPYALFGHSMGAVVAFELARRLRHAGKPDPARLFVSARRAPDLPDRWPPIRQLPDRELIAEVQRRYGGISSEVLANDELLDLFVPVLRADLTALGTYRYTGAAPLACPISCFGGAADAWVAADELEHWRTHTTAGFDLRVLPGAHFYLENEGRGALLATLQRALAGAAAHPHAGSPSRPPPP
jgi:surfactin synthase thioesterase subunit